MADMRKVTLVVLAVLLLLAALFCFGQSAVELLIAYTVHQTGQFHGMPFQVGQTVRAAVWSFLLAVVFLLAGLRIARRPSLH